jgi:hypothetical protein
VNLHRIYDRLGGKFRKRRLALFTRLLDMSKQAGIVDLGGDAQSWEWLDGKERVTLVNLDARCLEGHRPSTVADVVATPFADRAFEIVFSNSVIEHLGTEERQNAFANEVRRLSRSGYFVQTPNKWFPIEPHYLAFYVQLVPLRVRPAVIRWATLWGWMAKPSRALCEQRCREIRLLGGRQMHWLFPEAKIYRERFFGLTKSFIAVWHASCPVQSVPPVRQRSVPQPRKEIGKVARGGPASELW